MKKDVFITIVGFNNYYGLAPFKIGNLIRLKKEPENPFDSDAIRAFLPSIGTIGYVANGYNTIAGGTMSSGRIYDRVKPKFYARIMFTTKTKVICKVEFDNFEMLNKEFQNQTSAEAW